MATQLFTTTDGINATPVNPYGRFIDFNQKGLLKWCSWACITVRTADAFNN